MERTEKKFERALADSLIFKNKQPGRYVEAKRVFVVVTEFGPVFDNETRHVVNKGTEKQFIRASGFSKSKKGDATHHIIVCENVGPNGTISGLISQIWAVKA